MITNYCNHLSKDEFEFYVVYQHEPNLISLERVRNAGCEAIQVTARKDNFIKSIFDTCKVIIKCKPDIVHANISLNCWTATIPAMLLGVKTRISHSHTAEKRTGLGHTLYAWVSRFLIKHSSNVLMTCGKEAALYLFGKTDDVFFLRNAIDIEQFDKCHATYRTRYQLENRTVLGHMGHFVWQKNHKRLIDIFYEYKKKNEKAVLLLVGMGPLEEEIREYVLRLKIDKSVFFLGGIDVVGEFYASIDLFIMPSVCEGFPMVGIEAQAAGVKSLFSDNIDEDIKLTNLASLFSLEKDNKEWAIQIDKVIKKSVDTSYKKELEEKGYSIFREVNKLGEIYIRCYTENR